MSTPVSDMGWGPSWDADARLREADLDLALVRRRAVIDAERLIPELVLVTPPTWPDTAPDTAPIEVDDTGRDQQEDPYGDMNRLQLREACKTRGLSQQGTTTDMRDRLLAADSQQ